MKLKVKLLLAFFMVLLLTLVTAYVGWQAMKEMGSQTTMANHVDKSLARLLRAEVRQLLFEKDPKPERLDSAHAYLKEADAELVMALEVMRNPERRKLTQDARDFITWYDKKLTELQQSFEASAKASAAITQANTIIDKNFLTLLTNINEYILNSYTLAAFEGSMAANEAYTDFYKGRLASRTFTAFPTEENATIARKTLQLADEAIQDTRTNLNIASNRELADTIIVSLGEYIKNFDNLTTLTLSLNALSGEIRSELAKSVDDMERLSKLCSENSLLVQEDSNIQTLIVTLIAMFLGTGIALFLNSNVQKQLGKDPGELVLVAQKVINNDFNIDDGSPKIGVYANILTMVKTLGEHIRNAEAATLHAFHESEKAKHAMQEAEQSSLSAQQKTQHMLDTSVRLEEIANIVSTASAQLAAQIEQSERGAAHQASRVTETATAMEEMNSTVLEVAKNASAASEVSAQTRHKAEEGSQVVQEALKGIEQVQKQSLALKTDMSTLSGHAQAISQIMGVISDIADQTNLLALNAAIEAARAGEAGRGFAVVADEVRKLAEKTMISTTEVGNAIKAIQDSAAKSTRQVDATVQNIEKATELSTRSGEALQEIVTMVDHTADQVRAIATASEEQSASSEEINHSIVEVNHIASETARSMQEASLAVSDLAKQAHQLTSLIESMKKG